MNTLGIWTDPDRMGSKPCVKNTRLTVAQLLAELAEGRTISEIANTFELEVELMRGVLDELALWFDKSWCDGPPDFIESLTED